MQGILETSDLISVRAPFAKRWTRDECCDLEKQGFLKGRYELVEGEIILRMRQNPPHVVTISRIFAWLIDLFGIVYVQCQTAIDVRPEDNPNSEPEPDIAVLIRPIGSGLGNPKCADIRILVEVSDTTLRYDLTVKAGLYARAGIAAYLVADVSGRRIIHHSEPVEGIYQQIRSYDATETFSLLSAEYKEVQVSTLLPDA